PAPAPATGVVSLTTAKPYAAVTVPADGRTVATPFTLRKGVRYQLTAAGLYGYGGPDQVADASCRWSPSQRRWSPWPTAAVARSHGSLNLTVDGVRVSASTCRADHLYTRTLTPTATRALRLRVANSPALANGSLTLLVSKPGAPVRAGLPTYPATGATPTVSTALPGPGLIAETVAVAPTQAKVRTLGSLEAGAGYRVTVTGTAALGDGLGSTTMTDGRCVSLAGRWYQRASLDRRNPAADHGRLYLDGLPFDGSAPSGATCASRTHVATLVATRTGRLELAVHDPVDRSDDTGELSVEVQRLTPLAVPAAARAERPVAGSRWRQARDTVRVSSAAATGALSTMRLRTGESVDLLVRGTQRSGRVTADASCVAVAGTWRRVDDSVALGQDPLELWVDGAPAGWRPAEGGAGCSARDHAYRARFTATKNGPVNLAVFDLDHHDNSGALTVTMTRR
ncbi:MAG: hypothetical protein WB798_09535, partial [Nocardioidaceae bacterium]